jgi:hypothetical protein
VLQAGRSPVRIPDEVDFFNLSNPSSHTMALRSTQSLTKRVTGIFMGVKSGWLVGLIILPPSARRMWEPQPLATPRASTVSTGIHLLYYDMCFVHFNSF